MFQTLQADVEALEHWLTVYKMSFNETKSQCISFKKRIHFDIKILVGNLKSSQTVKYLGVHLSANLS